jgi:hypothetical protein
MLKQAVLLRAAISLCVFALRFNFAFLRFVRFSVAFFQIKSMLRPLKTQQSPISHSSAFLWKWENAL